MFVVIGKDQFFSIGKKKRKRVKVSILFQVNGIIGVKSLVFSNFILSFSIFVKILKLQKKKEKLLQVNGVIFVFFIEFESKKYYQEVFSIKEVIRKFFYFQFVLLKKRVRLFLVSRSFSLLQSGVKKRRVVSRRVQIF